MQGNVERRLFILVVAVSLGLTGLTVWAVATQAAALRARELADLRNAAATAAARAQAALVADADRALDQAGAAHAEGADAELEAWIATRPRWLLVARQSPDGRWAFLPRTPLEEPLPGAEVADTQPGRDLLATLRTFQRMAADPDPLTRAGALLAVAACEQQLGHPLSAARIFAEAAQLLRSTPHLARFAFRAEAARIESLLAAGDHERALDSFAAFLDALLLDHPGRLGPREAARLEEAAGRLNIRAADPLAPALGELRERAHRREAIRAAAGGVLRTASPGGGQDARAPAQTRELYAEPLERPEFRSVATENGETVVLVRRPNGAGATVVLLAPFDALLNRYWGETAQETIGRLQLATAGEGQMDEVLARLGPEFAGAVVRPTPEAGARLAGARRRQMTVVIAAGAASAGAWLLVIWMFSRAIARQRELARLQGRFVADVSHELKTPLALIRLLSETLADRRVRDPERMHAYHETITREAERLSLLLDNILDLGRIESGRKRYEFRPCNVGDVARQAWTLFEPQFAAEHFDARLEIAPDLPVIRADGQALQQVLVNLLQNAYRYASEGRYVRLAVAREGYVVVFTVEDHGIGMSRSQLRRLGESFFRAEDTRVRQQRGVGLGLAICQHIVTAHRGKVEVHSRPGQGSKFTVWIPFEPATGAVDASFEFPVSSSSGS
ncbi:MAG: HAMP domain-containing sensor histidine kinase [Planctomycetota bacterium]